MSSQKSPLKSKISQLHKTKTSQTSVIETLVIIGLLGVIFVLGAFIWSSLTQRQGIVVPSATPETVLERSAPVSTQTPAAPQSWYVIVTEQNPITATPLQYVAPPDAYTYVQQPAHQSVAPSVPQTYSSEVGLSDSQLCGGAGGCNDINSCEQAYACLRIGLSIDGDNDGIPCERQLICN